MAKRNKLRYQSQGNPYPPLIATGRVFLRHRDRDLVGRAAKGDLQVYLSTDAFAFNAHIGDYDAMGLEGYLKAEVFDGKGWRPLSLEEFFPGREQYFGKREKPSDVCRICLEILEKAKGVVLLRTYREHYVRAPEASEDDG